MSQTISIRTRTALVVAGDRGARLGGYRGTPPPATACAAVLATRRKIARSNAVAVAGTIREIRTAGITSANGIAAELNRRGITTARGGRWQAVQVQRAMMALLT